MKRIFFIFIFLFCFLFFFTENVFYAETVNVTGENDVVVNEDNGMKEEPSDSKVNGNDVKTQDVVSETVAKENVSDGGVLEENALKENTESTENESESESLWNSFFTSGVDDIDDVDDTYYTSSDINAYNNDLGMYYLSGALIERSQEPNYNLNIPTTTALGVAGSRVLDKLKIDKPSETSAQGQDVNKSTSAAVVTSSDTKRDTKKQEEVKQTPSSKKILKSLPFDPKLILSGRKLIGVNYSGTIYDEEKSGKRSNSGDFSMEQELQMKIKGSVGDRLELNVDFDDTQDDKKDISIVYKGKDGEFVREAAFGDINVSLPSTEFSGYSKELFGAKIDTQYKGLKTNAFFSKTKGYSESKQFKGSSIPVREIDGK